MQCCFPPDSRVTVCLLELSYCRAVWRHRSRPLCWGRSLGPGLLGSLCPPSGHTEPQGCCPLAPQTQNLSDTWKGAKTQLLHLSRKPSRSESYLQVPRGVSFVLGTVGGLLELVSVTAGNLQTMFISQLSGAKIH